MLVHLEPTGLSVKQSGLDEYLVLGQDQEILVDVGFQCGPIPANGVNGATIESLIAIALHRTQTLNGKFPCTENEVAIDSMKAALAALNERTAKRIARGVEGKEVK